MKKLIKLPNGALVDPKTVTSIAPVSASKSNISELEYPPRVAIDAGGTHYTICIHDGSETPQQMADRLAEIINEKKENEH